MIEAGKQFKAKLDALVAAKDLDGLRKLRTNRVVAEETARTAFAKNRSEKNGIMYRRRGVEKGLVNSTIRNLESGPLDEAGIADRLKSGAVDMVKNARDRVLNGFGNQEARGRLDLNSAVAMMNRDWNRYVGRQVKAGDTQIKTRPTHQNLINFIKFTYDININDGALVRAFGGNSSPIDSLKSTSMEEYNVLRGKFITEALTDTFVPKEVFPKLANFLIDRGALYITRGKERYGAVGVPDARRNDSPANARNINNGQSDDTGPQTTSTRVTADGHAIDINKMKKSLIGDGVSGANMEHLKELIGMGGQKAYEALQGDRVALKTMSFLVKALFVSISGKDDAGNVDAQHSITADGHIFDINEFAEELQRSKVSGADLNFVRGLLNNKGGEGQTIMSALADTGSRASKIIFAIANAALHATAEAE